MKIKHNKIIFYRTESIKVEFEVHFEDETFWLTQKKMSELFGVEVNTVNYHLKEIFKSGELSPEATIRKFRIVQKEGTRNIKREAMSMLDLQNGINKFLEFNAFDVLEDFGSI